MYKICWVNICINIMLNKEPKENTNRGKQANIFKEQRKLDDRNKE